jgi:hypothetical protein
MRVHAAAPINCFQLLFMRKRSKLLRFELRAMVAPEVVLTQRLEPCPDPPSSFVRSTPEPT